METVVNRGFRGETPEQVDFYNLDAIIAVGYRVSSARATKFRQWATSVLKEFIKKGFVLDEERLKQGNAVLCLMYEDGKDINNQSVRERFELGKNDSSVASRIISDTVDKGFIKPANSDATSKKYMTYVPYYA